MRIKPITCSFKEVVGAQVLKEQGLYRPWKPAEDEVVDVPTPRSEEEVSGHFLHSSYLKMHLSAMFFFESKNAFQRRRVPIRPFFQPKAFSSAIDS